MTPYEIRQSNIDHFTLLLERTSDPGERLLIEELRDAERLKPDDAYPTERGSPWPSTRRDP